VALLLEGGVPMKRFLIFLALIAISVPVSMNLATAGDEPVAMQLEKDSHLFGRILGSHVLMYPTGQIAEPVYEFSELPEMTQIKGFEVLNTTTGEWHQLTLSEDGHFCAHMGMGRYDLRGRDRNGQPFVIHSFTVPRGMVANLGEFWIEIHDPGIVARESWFGNMNRSGWREYQVGSGRIAMHLEHVISDEAYEECEIWFGESHEEVYDKFAGVIARR